MIKALLSLILLFSPGVQADCPSPVSIIKQGDSAVCSGFLFSDDAEKQASQARDDAKYYQIVSNKLTEKTSLLENQNEILEKRLNLYIQQSDILSQKVGKSENSEGIIRLAYFVLGCAVTGYLAANLK